MRRKLMDAAIITVLEIAMLSVVLYVGMLFQLYVGNLIHTGSTRWDSNITSLIFNIILVIISIFIFKSNVRDTVKASAVGVLLIKIFLFMLTHTDIPLFVYVLLIVELLIFFTLALKPWYYYYAVVSSSIIWFLLVLSALSALS